MEKREKMRVKKPYVEPQITSCEVAHDAYATGSGTGGRNKWLEYCVFFSCCDRKVLWHHC